MSKKFIIAFAIVFAAGALAGALLILPKTRSAEAVKPQRGWYYGNSIDQGMKSIGIDPITETFALLFTQPYDSYYCSGRYTVEGDRLTATDRATGKAWCTFRIEKDGSLVLLEDESPYFETKPSPFFASFEDGTVFTFGGKLEAGLHFGS